MTAAHAARARELGLCATNMPAELGGGGCTALQQVLVQEQAGRVTNALGWVAATPPSWLPAVATEDQLERYVRPAVRGEREECYAITEEGAGSDVAAIEATARRDGDGYLLNGTKWHVTSYNTADFAFFQAKLDGGAHRGEHAMFLVDLPSPGVSVVRTPAYTHTISHHHPIVAFTDVRVPAANLIGAEGDGMSFAYEWFRFERLMVAARCLGAAGRLTAEMTAFARERRAGGRPISEYGLVGGMLADSMTELFAARALLYETARGIDRGRGREGRRTRSARWPSCTAPRWPAGSPTGPSRCSAAAATCGRTWPSGSTASCGWSGSGRARARSSARSSPARWSSAARCRWPEPGPGRARCQRGSGMPGSRHAHPGSRGPPW